MRKFIILISLALTSIASWAQTESTPETQPIQVIQQVMQRFGYIDYENVLRSMPEYEAAQKDLQSLREKCNSEMKRAEEEFNHKYIEMLEGQKSFPENIMKKRQKELEDLLQSNLRFQAEMKELIDETAKKLEAPIRNKLTETLNQYGNEKGYAYILNTSENTYPFINLNVGEDITAVIKQKLNCK